MNARSRDPLALGRRAFLAGALAAVLRVRPARAGDAAPRFAVPPLACDCHVHVYDPRLPSARRDLRIVPHATLADYRRVQRRLGLSRCVVVTPARFPASLADNRATLDALAALGPTARGVASVHAGIAPSELRALAQAGVRGIRFSLTTAGRDAPPVPDAVLDAIETLARGADTLGWHVQLNLDAGQIAAAAPRLARLPAVLVFDHLGHLPPRAGTAHPAFAVLRRLIDRGRTWMKLSVTAGSSAAGSPSYAGVRAIGAAFVHAAPERVVWGSNWPHPSEPVPPDDAGLLDLLAGWAPDEATRRRILVENPAALYGFGG